MSCCDRRQAAGMALLAGFLLLAAGLAGAQPEIPDPYLDPLAFARVDSAATDVPVIIADQATGEDRAVAGRRLIRGSAEVYLKSSVVAEIFHASRFWQPHLGHLDLKIAGAAFRVTLGSRLVVGDGGEALLPLPVVAQQGDLWLPVTALVQVLGPGVHKQVVWDGQALRLAIGSVEFNVRRLTTEVLGRTTVVHVHCSQPLGYRATSPRAGRIELKIYGGQIDPAAAPGARARGLLQRVSSRQMTDHVLVELQVDQLVGHFRTYAADDGRQIVVVLEEEQIAALPEPVPRGEVNLNIQPAPVDRTHEIEVRTVVIDPGHGGHDVGAVGPAGILEKDVNLAVARELRTYLHRHSDLKVVLTRESDGYLDLTERAELANAGEGDLFLSLHCNSWFNDGAEGLETYFLSPARSDWARSVAAAENRAGQEAELDLADDVDFIVWELVQNRFISSSSRLAETIQATVPTALGIPDRGVRQAGFRVLVGAYMPAVLVEMGFLSHPQEERRLADQRYRRRLAAALGEALMAFGTQMAEAQGRSAQQAEGGEHDR